MEGIVLKVLRLASGLSVAKAASLIGISEGHYRNLENLKTSVSIKMLSKVSNAYNIPLSRILFLCEMGEGGYSLNEIEEAISLYLYGGVDLVGSNYPVPRFSEMNCDKKVLCSYKIAVVWDKSNINGELLDECKKFFTNIVSVYSNSCFDIISNGLSEQTFNQLNEGTLWNGYDFVIYMPGCNINDIYFNFLATEIARKNAQLDLPIFVFNPSNYFEPLINVMNNTKNIFDFSEDRKYLFASSSLFAINHFENSLKKINSALKHR